MKGCAACIKVLPRESFSKKQWLKKEYRRRCKECVEANWPVRLKGPVKRFLPRSAGAPAAPKQIPPSAPAADDEGASCWICLEAGPDEEGGPLRRDCSCRGEAGFAHLSCMLKYAESKELWDSLPILRVCPNCKQGYQNNLALDLASEFLVSFNEKYPNDPPRLVLALGLKLEAFASMTVLEPEQIQEAKQIGSQMQSIIAQISAIPWSSTSGSFVRHIEANLYNNLGQIIAAHDQSDEGHNIALGYFEQYRDLCIANGFSVGASTAETNIQILHNKSSSKRISQGVSASEWVEKSKSFYEHSVKVLGEGNPQTIQSGTSYAFALRDVRRGIDSERLLAKLAALSNRVHGPDHDCSKCVESSLAMAKIRIASAYHQGKWRTFQALQYKDGGRKCVVQGPFTRPRNALEERQHTFGTEKIRYALGTPVVCLGVTDKSEIGDLRSYDKESDSYEVHFQGEGLEPCLVKHYNALVLFDLPDESSDDLYVQMKLLSQMGVFSM